MSIAYKIGRSIGRNPKAWAKGVLVAVLMLVGFSAFNNYATQQEQKRKEAEAQALAAQRQVAQAKRQAEKIALCTDGIEKLKQEAREFMRQGKPDLAVDALVTCESLMQDSHAKLLLADARKAVEVEERKVQKAQEAEQARLQAAEKARKKREGVQLGMTQQEVLDSSWGKPERINRTIASYGTHEQWVYGGRNYLYFKNGILTTIQN